MTKERVLSAIEALEIINPFEEFAYEKALLAYLSIVKIPIFVNDIPVGIPVFRSRNHEINNLFNDISDISLTPRKFISAYARCNKPFQTKFYCSQDRQTSYMEFVDYWLKDKIPGDRLYITIGRWMTSKTLSSVIITTPYKEKRNCEYDLYHGTALDKVLDKQEPEFREANILFYDYLFEKFRKPSKNDLKTYIITTAYCNLALSEIKSKANSIYYPSVPFGAQGSNWAINEQFINANYIELTHAMRNEFTVGVGDNGKLSFLETGTIESSKINIVERRIFW